MWGVPTEVALFGAAQIGLLLFGLGRMWSTQKAHGDDIRDLKRENTDFRKAFSKLAAQVARLEGEVRL